MTVSIWKCVCFQSKWNQLWSTGQFNFYDKKTFGSKSPFYRNEIIVWLTQKQPWHLSCHIPVHHQNMTTPALLPLSGRRIPTLSPGASSFPHHRATLRLSEKFILLLILSAFITLCFGAFFFLPDNSKHKRFDFGLEDVLIPHIESEKEARHSSRQGIHGVGAHDEHRHRWDLLNIAVCFCVSVSLCIGGITSSLWRFIRKSNWTASMQIYAAAKKVNERLWKQNGFFEIFAFF